VPRARPPLFETASPPRPAPSPSPARVHGYCAPEHLAWDSRWPRIQAELAAYQADLLFLQVGAAGRAHGALHGGGMRPHGAGARLRPRDDGGDSEEQRRAPRPGGAPARCLFPCQPCRTPPPSTPRAAAPRARQEVEAPVYERQLRPFLASLDYETLFNPRALAPGAAGPEEGVSLAWRRAAFGLVAAAPLQFSKLLGEVLPAGAGADPLAAPLLRVAGRRGEGAVAALLQHKPTGRRLLAAATHLFWDPNYPDVKVGGGGAAVREGGGGGGALQIGKAHG
jgi:hypothetical protein